MNAVFTHDQLALQGAAVRAELYGFHGLAEAFLAILVRQLAQNSPRAAPPCEKLTGGLPTRPCYGKFRLNEADECALEREEPPEWLKAAFPEDCR